MPPKIISDDQLADRLLDVFRSKGFEGSSLSDLHDATGLGRSSLYHRFPNGKEDMAAAALERTIYHFSTVVFADRNQEWPAPRRLKSIIQALRVFYDEGRMPCLLETLSVGTPPEQIATLTQQAVKAWIETFKVLAIESGVPPKKAEERATDAVGAIEGALVIARTTGSTGAFDRAMKVLPNRLLSK